MSPLESRTSTAPKTSTAPILSIFTLRPRAVTLRPAEAPPLPAAPRRRRVLVAVIALCGLGLLGWTLGKAAEPRREPALPVVFVNGAPKHKVTDRGKPERWGSEAVKVRIDASVNDLGPGALTAVQSGFGAWLGADATLPSLSFDTTSGAKPALEPDGVNTVMFRPIELPGHKKDLALTISFVDANTGRILESDIVINAKKPFGTLGTGEGAATPSSEDDDESFDSHEVPSCGGVYDLQSVVTHEVGHFFGLGEDHDDAATTMFFKTGKCEIRKRDLEAPDRSVMISLYQQPAPESGATDSGGGCGGASVVPRRPEGHALLAIGLALVAWARRGRRAA